MNQDVSTLSEDISRLQHAVDDLQAYLRDISDDIAKDSGAEFTDDHDFPSFA